MSSVADAVRAALKLAKRDPEAQRVATRGRVELRFADRVVSLADAYGVAVAEAAALHRRADALERMVERAVEEGRPRVGGVPLLALARRVSLRRKQGAAQDGRARAALLGLLALGINEDDVALVDRIIAAHKADASA